MFLEQFLSVLQCRENTTTGKLMNYYAHDMECYTGQHVIHCILGLLAALLFFTITTIFAGTYYECRNDPLNCLAK